MGCVSVEEVELLSFFAVEPQKADCNVPWPYNDYTYRVSLSDYRVEFGIHPAYKDVSLSVTRDGAELYRISALSVHDVCYHNHPNHEVLEIVVSERDRIWLRIRPTVLITQEAGMRPDNTMKPTR